ncbi:uncharacterized protein PV07_03781 [Cladophialophora immunda]|uniref:Uncharacterized protein n=1 Tax=Cladophialophora immunda TaxID=569365 RepID=A0A0D1ZVK8_9EURO|nr:uncharacterized protein PV07_03781 [Cladophialophora immunda]KIW32221.1 hypothetical protein PV07_03781 [Cladophialophora immunda]
MPTRWLSIRKRNPLLHNESTAEPSAKQQEFDFAFGESSSAGQGASGRIGPRLVQIRPTTSGSPTGKRKLRVEVPSIRPRTSDNHKPSPLQNVNGISKSEDSLIGLAFGSPSHPPAFFCGPPEESSAVDQNPVLRQHPETPGTAAQMHSKRWRKLGTLFKSRQAAIRRDDVPSGPTIGLPTGFVVLDKDPAAESPKVEGDKQRTTQPDHPRRDAPPPPPIEKNQKSSILKTSDLVIQKPEDDLISRPSTATATDAGSTGEPYTRPPLPKLELDIPFNLPAAKRSSSLLARRSKALDSLKSFDDSRPTTQGTNNGDSDERRNPESEPLTPLMPPRRLTTPTMTRSPAASKYSLFPTTSPAPVKIVGRVPGSDHDTLPPSQLRRSATSPARLSPMQDHFSSVPKPEPLNPNKIASMNEHAIHSPEDNTASTDREAPWSSAHSFQSSVSSATTVDEIFFDIKSFRDSKGVEDGQFVMTRPDSVQVELARTRSKRAPAPSHLRHVEASSGSAGDVPERITLIPPEPPAASSGAHSALTTKHTSVNTAYFDEAIAAVERLTAPTGSAASAVEKVPSIPTLTIAHHDEKPHQLAPIVTVQQVRPSDHQSRLTSKTHEEVGRLIPSPVVEVKEDESPRSNVSPISVARSPSVQQPQATKGVPPRLTAIKRVDRPIDDSPTIPQGPPSPKRTAKPTTAPSDDKPPPVPKKDAKFIPLSKYAAKSTVTAIEQRAGVVPTRPVRANTEDLALRSAAPRASKERSATLPSSLQPHSHDVVHKSSLRGLEKVIPPRPNPVASNPVTAEVAVARTVSLSRKQSARIHVPGPRLAARRAEAQAQAQAQSQAQPSSQSQLQVGPPPQQHMRNPSSTSQRSNKSQRTFLGGGHRHKRTASSAKSASRASKDLSANKNALKVTKPQPDGKTGSSFGKFLWSKESEKQLIKEARKWEILEKKSYSPVVVQAARGHRPGVSVGLVVESI